MIKTQKITYKVFLFERVKKKVMVFNTETYPLQIRLTSGSRTVYLKSYFFGMMQQNKYLQEVLYNHKTISIENIIACEEDLIQYILNKDGNQHSLEPVRQEYAFLCRDILHELDEGFKNFMVDFFYAEKLPAYALFIKNDGANHTSEFILTNLEKSLQQEVYKKLLRAAVEKAPPYIPLISFFRQEIKNPLPVLSVYQWLQEKVSASFILFVKKNFPEYEADRPAEYINGVIQTMA